MNSNASSESPKKEATKSPRKAQYRVVALSVRTGAPTRRNRCAYEGCTRYRRKKSFCTAHHYEMYPRETLCKAQRCLDVAVKDGFCVRHFGHRIKCAEPSCDKFLLTDAVPRCQTHQYACSVEGCLKKRRRKDMCIKHYDQLVFGRRPSL